MTNAPLAPRPDVLEVDGLCARNGRALSDRERKIAEALLDAKDKASLVARQIERRRRMLALLADVEQLVRKAGFAFDDGDAAYVIDEWEADPRIQPGELAERLLAAKRSAPKDPSAAPA